MVDLKELWKELHPHLEPTVVQGDTLESTIIGYNKNDDLDNLCLPYTITELMYAYLDIKEFGAVKSKYRKAEMKKVRFKDEDQWDGPYYAKVFEVVSANGDVNCAIYFKDNWKLYHFWEVYVTDVDDVWDVHLKEFI